MVGSGAGCEYRQFVFGDAHTLGQDNAEAVEECSLGDIRLRHAAQANLALCCGGQDHIMRLNTCEFFKDRSRRVSEARMLLPHLEALPQHEGEKADQDMGLNAILALMPDRTYVQLILLDTESGFSLCELDIGLPQLLIAPVVNVRAQQIGALREHGPVVE